MTWKAGRKKRGLTFATATGAGFSDAFVAMGSKHVFPLPLPGMAVAPESIRYDVGDVVTGA